MKKFAGNLITFLCALGILWILVSWADVIAHNTTYQQKEQTLHKKKTGEYFVYAHGGAYSSFGDSYGGQGCAGEKFILMSVEQAQQWSEEYLDADEYIAIWGEPEE